jgi:hypothetical protein
VRACSSCERRIPDQVVVCAFCGARQGAVAEEVADTLPAPETTRDELIDTHLQQRRQTIPGAPGPGAPGRPPPMRMPPASTPGLVVMGEGTRGGTSWTRAVVIAGILSLGGAYAAWKLSPSQFPLNALTPVGADEVAVCKARPTCVVVYLAPWSEASNASIPLVERLRDRWRDSEEVGIAVVVGHDTPDRVERFANALGESTWADTDDEVLRTLEIKVAPSWFTLDGAGRIQTRVDGSFFPLELQLEKLRADQG